MACLLHLQAYHVSEARMIDALEENEESLDPATKSFRVLLIEDSPTVRGYLRKVLIDEFPGAEIREAEEGRAAFRELSKGAADLIVTDLEMPGMDGHTFLARMRAHGLLKHKPILVMSGSLSPEIQNMAASDSCLRFLAKPARAPEISLAIHQLLKSCAGTN